MHPVEYYQANMWLNFDKPKIKRKKVRNKMTLMEQIKVRQVAERKAGNSAQASLLTTLLGEAAMVGKNSNRETTDQEVVAVIKKFIKNIDETISALQARNQSFFQFLVEREVLEQFLPQQLTESALIDVAKSQPNMPAFMKHLKENFAGKYDGKLASTVAKQIFQ
jgi:uncharacterized protein YqeY